MKTRLYTFVAAVVLAAFVTSAAAQGIDFGAFARGAEEAQQANHRDAMLSLQLQLQNQQLQWNQAWQERFRKHKQSIAEYNAVSADFGKSDTAMRNRITAFLADLHTQCPGSAVFTNGLSVAQVFTDQRGIDAMGGAVGRCPDAVHGGITLRYLKLAPDVDAHLSLISKLEQWRAALAAEHNMLRDALK